MRASIKIPFRLIKWLSTLTNGKDLIVLGVLFPFSHNPQSPLFRGAASTACLGMLFPMAACALHIYSPSESHTAAGNKTQLDKINLRTSWWNLGEHGARCDSWCKGSGAWRKAFLVPEWCQGAETTSASPMQPCMGCKKMTKTLQKLFYILK